MTTRTHTQTWTTTGAKTPMSMEAMLVCETTLAVIASTSSGGGTTYTVEVTLDDVNDSSVTVRWLTLSGLSGTTTTTDAYTSFSNPWAFCRINISAIGGGSVEFKMLQSFNQV